MRKEIRLNNLTLWTVKLWQIFQRGFQLDLLNQIISEISTNRYYHSTMIYSIKHVSRNGLCVYPTSVLNDQKEFFSRFRYQHIKLKSSRKNDYCRTYEVTNNNGRYFSCWIREQHHLREINQKLLIMKIMPIRMSIMILLWKKIVLKPDQEEIRRT